MAASRLRRYGKKLEVAWLDHQHRNQLAACDRELRNNKILVQIIVRTSCETADNAYVLWYTQECLAILLNCTIFSHTYKHKIENRTCDASYNSQANKTLYVWVSTNTSMYTFEVWHLLPFLAVALRVYPSLGMADLPRRRQPRRRRVEPAACHRSFAGDNRRRFLHVAWLFERGFTA